MRLPLGLASMLTVSVLVASAVEPVVAPKPAVSKIDEPVWLPVEDLRADEGTATLLLTEGNGPATKNRRFVMVRGVWPAAAQRRELARVIHPRGGETADPTLVDFELERQVVGPKGETSVWERVDIEVVLDLLNRAVAWAKSGVDPAFEDSVITALLPERENGAWGDEASHPRLKTAKPGDLLLFRCPDFDVRPGETYRYRVRLQVVNPNHGLPRERVARPEVAEGLTRWTPWSEPSEPVTVPE